MATTTHTNNVEVYGEEWIVTTIIDGLTLTQTAKRAKDGSPLVDMYEGEPMVLTHVDDVHDDDGMRIDVALEYYTQTAPHAIFMHAGW